MRWVKENIDIESETWGFFIILDDDNNGYPKQKIQVFDTNWEEEEEYNYDNDNENENKKNKKIDAIDMICFYAVRTSFTFAIAFAVYYLID